jgi:hypothetical protein
MAANKIVSIGVPDRFDPHFFEDGLLTRRAR